MQNRFRARGGSRNAVVGPVAAAAALLAAMAFPAAAQEELLKKYACLSCHAVDHKLVGPAYKDVADKYRGDKDAAQKLKQKVKRGGSGVWGQIPMPPNPTVPDADLVKMITWVLSH